VQDPQAVQAAEVIAVHHLVQFLLVPDFQILVVLEIQEVIHHQKVIQVVEEELIIIFLVQNKAEVAVVLAVQEKLHQINLLAQEALAE